MKVAIDGFAGSGKSTISKRIAEDLNFIYIDTGAMYRMITLYYLEKKLDVNKDINVEELSKVSMDMKNNKFFLNKEDVTQEIRNELVTNSVALVAAHKNVRELLVLKQRELAQDKNVILDGRDIGTVVFPDAEVKIYLTASLEARAMRRHKQLIDAGMKSDYNQQIEDIKQRDYLEINREISPLKKADDAIEIDSSDMSEDAVYKKIKDIILLNIR